MTNDDPRKERDKDQPKSGDAPGDSSTEHARREPVFTDFDEDEEYGESDRDTDYAAAYEDEDGADDDCLDDAEDVSQDWQVLGADANPRESGLDDGGQEVPGEGETGAHDETRQDMEPEEQELFEDNDDLADEDDEGWEEFDEYTGEEEVQAITPQQSSPHWPWGLVVVAVVALVLLVAGGYGIIQQRSAAQEEIRQLQATLATAANPGEVAAGRKALREMEERITRSQATIDELTLENTRLTDTISGLEQQLSAQKAAPAVKPPPASETTAAAAVKPAPAPKPAPAAKPAAPATAKGAWFVNFSSYGQRSVAESWRNKLKPSLGKTIVTEGSKNDRTYYRVRIVGLADRAQAEKVAKQLQDAYGLPPLWLGKE